MIQLNEEQVARVTEVLSDKNLHYIPLKEELLDHLCCQVEEIMSHGQTFEQALHKSLDTFSEDEIEKLQVHSLSLSNQKQSFIMKVSIAALITCLVICSANWIYHQDPPDISPLAGTYDITSGFGMRMHPIKKVKKMHKGIDLKAPLGTPVQATSDGIVVKAEFNKKGYGNYIVIQHDEHYKTLYSQLSRMDVKVGQKVKKGSIIGAVGNSGAATGPHLHYEVIEDGRNINPEGFIKP